ncbi:hypothetical protein JCM10207_003758 [Rhodosporidiobolus poonsookiae]
MTQRVAIIGGGIIGASTAFQTALLASQRGLPVDVTLIEGSSVAAGASGKAGGLLALDWHGPSTASLAALSYKLHATLAREHGGADRWGFRQLDTLSVSADLSAKGAKPRTRALKNADLFPWLNKDVLTSSSILGSKDTTSQVHPEQFTAAMVEEAQKLGAKVVFGTVTALTKPSSGADGPYKLTVRGRDSGGETTVEADQVVVAAGPWTGELLKKLGVAGGRARTIRGSRAHSIVLKTAPGRDLPAQALFTSIKTKGGEAEPEVYNRPDGTSYICGPTDGSDLPTLASSVTVDDAAISKLLAQAAQLAPTHLSTSTDQAGAEQSALAEVVRRQACYLPVGSGGGDPVIGKLEGDAHERRGVYVASGHSCWGICNGPGTGLVMAELLLDGKVSSADIDELAP